MLDPNYVPFDRDVIGRPSAKKKGFRRVPIYRAKGRTYIYNPIESIILRVDNIHLAEQNYIRQLARA